MKTIYEFLEQHPDLVFSYQSAGRRPMNPGERPMDAWKVKFQRHGRHSSFDYFKGTGHNGEPPTAAEVLDALASDARSVQFDGNFQTITLDDFMSEFLTREQMQDKKEKARYGMIFRKIIDNSQRLSKLFSPQQMKELINEVESL
jgi:hypothetical protein